jgi:hypothetical protein
LQGNASVGVAVSESETVNVWAGACMVPDRTVSVCAPACGYKSSTFFKSDSTGKSEGALKSCGSTCTTKFSEYDGSSCSGS